MRSRRRVLILLVAIFILSGITAGGLFLWHQHQNAGPLPRDVARKVSFDIFYPDQDQQTWTYDKQHATYDSDSGVLTLQVVGKGKHIVLTQQASPDVFKDIPQQYSRMLNLLQQYSELKTGIGTVALTHPKELKGGQAAVTYVRDTLVFAKPDHALSDSDWKDFFNQLAVEK